jgi:hypothetical protein
VAGTNGLVGGFGGHARIGGVDRDERLELGLQPVDPRKVFVDQIDRGQSPQGDLGRLGVDGKEHGGLHGRNSVSAGIVPLVAARLKTTRADIDDLATRQCGPWAG